MKKIIVLFLATLLVLGTFGAVSTSAASGSTWPYIYENFEDKASIVSVSGSDPVEYVTDTPDGSDWAYKFNVMASTNRDIIVAKASSGVTIHNGDTVSITMDMKLSANIGISSATMYIHYLADGNENFTSNGFLTMSGSTRPVFSLDGTNTSWQKASCVFKYSGADVNVNGSMGISITMPGKTEAYTVTLDNVEVMAYREKYTGKAPANKVIYENDFSEDMSGITYTGTTAEGSGLAIVAPAENENEQVLQMTDTDTTKHVKFKLALGQPMKQGVYYALSYRARIVEAYDNSSGSPVAFGTSQSCKHRWTAESCLGEYTEFRNNNTWSDATILFYCDDKVVDSDGVIEMQWWIKYQSAGSDTGVYQLDDIKVEEIGGMVNGTFDYMSGLYLETGSAVNYSSTGSKPVAGWKSTNGKITANTSSKVNNESKIMGCLYFNNTDGSAYHTNRIFAEAGAIYEYEGWLRPCAANSAGTLEIGINYTYNDGTEANSVVLDTVATKSATSSVYQKVNASFTAPSNMATAELYVKQLSTVAEGQDISRLQSSSANLAYYTDEWKITKCSSPDLPIISNVGHMGAIESDGAIQLSYNFSALANATDLSYFKLYEGKKCILSGNTTGYIKLPALDASKSYKIVITPVDSNYNFGIPVEYDITVGSVSTADGVTVAFNDVGNTPKATIRIDDNFADLHPDISNVQLIVTAYDANGKMICTKIEPVSTVVGTTNTISLSGVDYTNVAKLKCFVWSNDGKIVPIKDSITRVPAQSISCWGDSLTQGDRSQNIDLVKEVDDRFASYSNISYSEVLAEVSGKSVRNFGCGGDNATSIACRQGGLDMLIGTGFTIPATTTAVDIDLDAENGIFINTLFQGIQNANLNPVVINGVEGTLSTVRYDDFHQLNEETFHYTFTRSTAGDAVTVPVGTKVIPASVREGEPGYAKKDIVVLFAGTNGGYNNSFETLFGIFDRMIENLEYEDKEYVIVCYPHFGLSSAIQRGEAFEARYGDRVVNLTELFRTDAEATFKKYGFTLTDTDRADLAAGNLPTSLLISDGVHFNAVGNYILGCEIYETMLELGILTK